MACLSADPHPGFDHSVVTFEAGRLPAGFARGIRPWKLDRESPNFIADFCAVIDEVKPDVVHAHGPTAAIYTARANCRVRSVITIHNSLWTNWPSMLAVRDSLRKASAVVAVSSQLARQAEKVSGRHVRVVSTGVDVRHFSPGPGSSAGRLRVGMAGRLHPVKRQIDMIVALRSIKFTGPDVSLVIAGEGPKRSRLETASQGLPVQFLGEVEDMVSFYRSLDVFALPSAHEGCPLALLEAMACGVPCVATSVGGIPEIAEDGSVLLVPAAKPAVLAAMVSKLLADATLRKSLAGSGVRRAAAYSLGRQRERYRQIYAELAPS